MFIKPCKKCGRLPVIAEIRPRNGQRQRTIRCPNYCSCLLPLNEIDNPHINKPPYSDSFLNSWLLIYVGEGDDNAIYKAWNDAMLQ